MYDDKRLHKPGVTMLTSCLLGSFRHNRKLARSFYLPSILRVGVDTVCCAVSDHEVRQNAHSITFSEMHFLHRQPHALFSGVWLGCWFAVLSSVCAFRIRRR